MLHPVTNKPRSVHLQRTIQRLPDLYISCVHFLYRYVVRIDRCDIVSAKSAIVTLPPPKVYLIPVTCLCHQRRHSRSLMSMLHLSHCKSLRRRHVHCLQRSTCHINSCLCNAFPILIVIVADLLVMGSARSAIVTLPPPKVYLIPVTCLCHQRLPFPYVDAASVTSNCHVVRRRRLSLSKSTCHIKVYVITVNVISYIDVITSADVGLGSAIQRIVTSWPPPKSVRYCVKSIVIRRRSVQSNRSVCHLDC